MSNAFIFSAANSAAQKHFQDTVKDGIALNQVLEHVTDLEERETLRRAYPGGKAFLWAGHSGAHDEGYWDLMVPGDLLLGYRERSIISAAFIVGKTKSASLGLTAWPDASERPYDLIYFMGAPKFLSRPVADLPRYFATMYQGLRRLPTSHEILKDFGNFDSFVRDALLNPNAAKFDDIEISHGASTENAIFFDTEDETDARDHILQTIVRRRGQEAFRRELVIAYEGQCAVTGCNALPALEAAHILPYRGKDTNRVQNGLLLRADIHTLFDLGLIAVESSIVRVSEKLANTEYVKLEGVTLRKPRHSRFAPSSDALAKHFSGSDLRVNQTRTDPIPSY